MVQEIILIKIIAGTDKTIRVMLFCTRLYCWVFRAEPLLDDSKTVIEIVREGVAETMAVLENLTKSTIVLVFQVYEDADKMDKLMDRQALLQDKIDALGAWEIDTKLEIAMDALLLMQILQ
jgi:hypothetical protein